MPAPDKSFTNISDSAIDADSPLTQDLMTQIRDNTIHLEQWLGDGYTAAKDHNHDGTNSALIEVGPNYQRNGSFESGLTVGWTFTQYTGGSYVINSSQEMDGQYCVAFTSTSTVNGGGDGISSAFMNVTGSALYDFKCVAKANVANVSSKYEVVWYDDAQAQISTSVIYTSTNTSTSASRRGRIVRAPSTARFAKLKVTGGIPGSGSATGTIYFDGVVMSDGPPMVEAGTGDVYAVTYGPYSTNATSLTLVSRLPVTRDGTYTVRFEIANSSTNTSTGRIYVNGVATGTTRTNGTSSYVSYDEDVALLLGDFVEIYASDSAGTQNALIRNFCLLGNAA